jgi:hydrogenase nickel incorporation protein HypA/HybF
MHELSIANEIIEVVRKEMMRYPATHAERVGIRVGALSAVDPAALQFCFEVMTRDTEFAQLKLDIEVRPRRHRCAACATQFAVKDYDFECPHCGRFAAECIGGEELELAFLEVEEHEPSTA